MLTNSVWYNVFDSVFETKTSGVWSGPMNILQDKSELSLSIEKSNSMIYYSLVETNSKEYTEQITKRDDT